MGGLRDWKSNNARAYFLQHPTASISECSKALGIGHRTCAGARALLASQGFVQAGPVRAPRKKRDPVLPEPPDPGMIVPSEGTTPLGGDTLRIGARLLDDATLRTLADPFTTLTDLDLDDDETRKRLLREVKRLAFSPATNPDTRLSATQVWLKLKDMAKSRDLGPGKPLTRAAAIARLVSLFKMVGADIAINAMYEAFNVQPDRSPTNGDLASVEGSESGGSPKMASDESGQGERAVPSLAPEGPLRDDTGTVQDTPSETEWPVLHLPQTDQ